MKTYYITSTEVQEHLHFWLASNKELYNPVYKNFIYTGNAVIASNTLHTIMFDYHDNDPRIVSPTGEIISEDEQLIENINNSCESFLDKSNWLFNCIIPSSEYKNIIYILKQLKYFSDKANNNTCVFAYKNNELSVFGLKGKKKVHYWLTSDIKYPEGLSQWSQQYDYTYLLEVINLSKKLGDFGMTIYLKKEDNPSLIISTDRFIAGIKATNQYFTPLKHWYESLNYVPLLK